MKKIISVIIAAAAALSMSGCVSSVSNAMTEYDFAEMNTDFVQLKAPNDGDTIAIVQTDLGEFRMVLYDEYAPNTVAAFIADAESGVYDNMPVYAVASDVYFMTGGHENEKGNYIGRSSDDELVENEYSVDLWPFAGAVMSYSEKTDYSDSRRFVCNTDAESLTEDAINQLKDSTSSVEDETARNNMLALFDKFYEVGGVFGLSGTVTVFGQTYEGMDVVERLCGIAVKDDGRADEEVMIQSVTISEYSSES